MASYDWINIEVPEDYEQLLGHLDGEFEPKRIVKRLKTKITSRVKAVLVEHDYIDKDYRSTLYNFYAKKGRPYRADCVRLHFFDKKVDFEVRPSDERGKRRTLDHHYYGYIVLRPTIRATLGRSVLSPDIRVGAHGSAIQGRHHVHLLGHRLSVWGFPSMDQHVDIAACAHVACWAVLRHYSQSYSQYREYLIYEIAKLATGFEPGGISPSRGLDVWEAERVFNAAGCFPIIVGRDPLLSTDEEFFGQLLAYMESGFPLFIGLNVDGDGHAIVAAGHNWKKGAAAAAHHVWGHVDTLLTVDDNLLPYVTVPVDRGACDGAEPDYSTENFESFIVALPEKIGYPAEAMAKYARVVEARLLIRVMGCEPESVSLHRYFMTTISGLRRYARENASQLGKKLVDLIMRLDTAQFVWVMEFSSPEQWAGGRVAARGIVDASASHKDPNPIWLLHNEEVAFVFDRSKAELAVQAVGLNRPGDVPLQRMEVNLRPVQK